MSFGSDDESAANRDCRASSWRLREHVLRFSSQPLLMGIVNATPDSFSDGGSFASPKSAVEHGLQLVDDGAAILDVGGESTRPQATPVNENEELRRVIPVVQQLCEQTDTPVSIDTTKANVAAEALAAGAEAINDVSALAFDPRMVQVAVDAQAGVCAMHMQGDPQTMQNAPAYSDVVADIYQYLATCRDRLVHDGIMAERICLDPGIGFGKTHEHNLALMRNAFRYLSLGCPILIGHSRKGFLTKMLTSGLVRGTEPTLADRDAATAVSALPLARQRIQLIRVHNVACVKQALRVFAACSEET